MTPLVPISCHYVSLLCQHSWPDSLESTATAATTANHAFAFKSIMGARMGKQEGFGRIQVCTAIMFYNPVMQTSTSLYSAIATF